MSEKMFNTRIIHKHDTAENWEKATGFIPKSGELIVYDPDENFSYARTKIGDGENNVNDLPFVEVQADWNQYDASAASYVKNRTHYITPDAVSVPPTRVNVDGTGYTYYVGQFEEGKTYNVIFDGTTYPCVWNFIDQTNYQQAYMGNGNIVSADIEDTGEPFVFVASMFAGMFPTYGIGFKENGTYTVGIEGHFEPTSITATDGYAHGFGPTLVSGNTYKVKWNGVEYNLTAFTDDSSSSNIFLGNPSLISPSLPSSEGNEPFCFNCMLYFNTLSICTTEKQENTFSIEGILPEQTRKFNIEFNPNYMAEIDAIWQQSLEENKEYTVILDGEEYNCICKRNDDFGVLYIGSEKPFYPLRTIDDYPFMIISMGLYTVKGTHEISIREDLVVKIDKKFLPPLVGEKNPEVVGAEIFNDYFYNIASGDYSHAEGVNTTASGECSHAEGVNTTASGERSHAEGDSTRASSDYQHVQGKYNIEDAGGKYSHIVGNGDYNERSNAHTLDWEGNAWYQGDVYIGSTSGTNRDDGSKKLATEEYVDNAAVQSDWNQNDESASDYIKNKPFGETTVIGEALYWDGNLEGRPTFEYQAGNIFVQVSEATPSLSQLYNGGIMIYADGSSREFSEEDIVGDQTDTWFAIGTHIHFVRIVLEEIEGIPKGTYILYSPGNAEYEKEPQYVETLVVNGFDQYEGIGIKTIDPKYLPAGWEIYKQPEEPTDAPEGALWVDTDEESGSGGSGGGGGVTSWNDLTDKPELFSGSWNDLTDKPFESVCSGDTLVIDYDPDNIDPDKMDSSGVGFLKVSDSIVTIEDLANGITYKSLNGASTELTADDVNATTYSYADGMLYNGRLNICFIEEKAVGVDCIGTTFPESGLYITAGHHSAGDSIYIPGYNFESIKTIDAKYLPKHLAFGEHISHSSTLFWDGDTTDLAYMETEFGGRFFKVSDFTPSVEDIESYKLTFYAGPTFDSESNPVYVEESGAILLGHTEGNGEHYYQVIILPHNDTGYGPKGIYFSTVNGTYVYSLTIPSYIFENKVNKTINAKYMPKYLQLREYIVEADTLTWDGNTSGLESGYLSHFKVSDSVPTEEDLVNGYEITFNNSSSTITNIEDPIYTDEEGFIYLGNTSGPGCPLVVISLYDSESNSKGIYFFYYPQFPRIESLKIPGYTFEVKESKLDKKYIPDSMPEVTAEDNGKFLRVVDGVWAAASIPTAEEVGALTEAQVTIMINNALGVIENGAY